VLLQVLSRRISIFLERHNTPECPISLFIIAPARTTDIIFDIGAEYDFLQEYYKNKFKNYDSFVKKFEIFHFFERNRGFALEKISGMGYNKKVL